MSESTDEPFTGGLVHKAFEVQSLRRMYAREEGQAMNERADRWSNCKCGAWFKVLGVSVVGFCPYCGAALSAAAPNNGTYCIHGIKCALCAEGAYPAGTGQPDECPLCGSRVRDIRLCLICDTSHNMKMYSNRRCIEAGKPNFCRDPWHGGDSVKGEGETGK